MNLTLNGLCKFMSDGFRRPLEDDEYLGVLKRIKTTIENHGLQYVHDYLSNDTKLYCNWGLCGNIKEHYPDPELHLYPDDFIQNDRMSPLRPNTGFDCPMRERLETDKASARLSGCYHSCRIFNAKKRIPTRDEALGLYDKEIEKVVNNSEIEDEDHE